MAQSQTYIFLSRVKFAVKQCIDTVWWSYSNPPYCSTCVNTPEISCIDAMQTTQNPHCVFYLVVVALISAMDASVPPRPPVRLCPGAFMVLLASGFHRRPFRTMLCKA